MRAGVVCYVCGEAGVGRCPRCGRLYCERHGGLLCQQCAAYAQRLFPPENAVPSARLYRSAIGALALALLITVVLLLVPLGPWPAWTVQTAATLGPPGVVGQVVAQPTIVEATPAYRSHTVVQGDTLLAIAIRYGTTVAAIVEANNLEDPHQLKIGQVLLIPYRGPEGTQLEETPTATPIVATPAARATPAYRSHTVVQGDTLLAIAIRYGTTVAAIVEANNLEDPHQLKIGQVLLIP